ncbi:MAG: tetratricopeptide repeat protein [bacterium]
MHLKFKKIIIAAITIFFAGNCFSCGASSWNTNRSGVLVKERALTSAINKNPQNTDASIQLINLYLDSNQEAKAMIELNRIQKRVNNSPRFFISAANSLLSRGMYKEAENMAKKAVKISYNNIDAFISLGNIYFKKANSLGNTPEELELKKLCLIKAFDNFYTAYKYNPSSPFAHIGLADVYYINGQSALALDEILKAKELSTNNAQALYLIGEYLYKTKEFAKSKIYLQKSISAGLTSNYKTYYMLAKLSEQEGNNENAQKNYIKSLKLKPEHQQSQQNLDRLIKISYNDSEMLSTKEKSTTDLFNNINDELNTIMQADLYLVADEFTKARESYISVLNKNPKNINAITGLAELYYAKWIEGFASSADFVNDSKYILKTKENSRVVIPLTKFKLINEDQMPEEVRQKFINLSISETFDFYDLLNEVRAEFFLGNFEDSHEKLEKLLTFKLSNYEKFKVLKSLCYDHNYDEALNLVEELKKTSYHNEELVPIVNRIAVKFSVADEKLNQSISLYSNKKNKKNDYVTSEAIIKQVLIYYPTDKKAYLNYIYLLEKQKKYTEALEKTNIYQKLYKLYPDSNSEIKDEDVDKLILRLNQKLLESEIKK